MILLLACPQLPFKDLSCLQNILKNYHNQTNPFLISLNTITPLASVISYGTDHYSLTMCYARKYFVSILWQSNSLSVPRLSCGEKIIIAIYFMCAAQDI